jgi:hypothetical protein
LGIKHQTPWGGKKSMLKMFYLYKKMRKFHVAFSVFVLLRFWTFLCMGSSKTPKTNLSKKTPKALKLKKKTPTHLRGRFFLFSAPLGARQASQSARQLLFIS